jgi:CheY-like chemotaxis protein
VKPHILVVEDYPDTRTILTMVLTRRGGYDVTVAANGKEALRLVDERFARTTAEGSRWLALDLLVVDIMMPAMSGLELLERLRDDFSSLPRAMIISALNDRERVAEAVRLGVSEYVTKPIEHDLLLYKVRTLLEADQASPFHWARVPPGSQITLGEERGVGRSINEAGLLVEMPERTGLGVGDMVPMDSAFFQQCGLSRQLTGRVLRVRALEQSAMVELVFVGLPPASVARLRSFSLTH